MTGMGLLVKVLTMWHWFIEIKCLVLLDLLFVIIKLMTIMVVLNIWMRETYLELLNYVQNKFFVYKTILRF